MALLAQELPTAFTSTSLLPALLEKESENALREQKKQPSLAESQTENKNATSQRPENTQRSSELLNKIFSQENLAISSQEQGNQNTSLQDSLTQSSLNQEINRLANDYIENAFPMLNPQQQQQFQRALAPYIKNLTHELKSLFTELAEEAKNDPVHFHHQLDAELSALQNTSLSVQANALTQITQQVFDKRDELLKNTEKYDKILLDEGVNINDFMYWLNLMITKLFEDTLKMGKKMNDLLAGQQKKYTEDQMKKMSDVALKEEKAVKSGKLERIFLSCLSFACGAIQVGMGLFSANPLIVAAGFTEMLCGITGLILEPIPMDSQLKDKCHLALLSIQGALNGVCLLSFGIKSAIKLGAKALIKFGCKNIDVTAGKMGKFLYGSAEAAAQAKQIKELAKLGIEAPARVRPFEKIATICTWGGNTVHLAATVTQTATTASSGVKEFDLRKAQRQLQEIMAMLEYCTHLTQESFDSNRTIIAMWKNSLDALLKLPEESCNFIKYATSSLARV